MIAYSPGWSYDTAAKALQRELRGRHEIRIAYSYSLMNGEMNSWPADLYVDMWWHGAIRKTHAPVLKQISSHRWSQTRWRGLSATNMLQRYAKDCSVIVPSVRLQRLLTKHDPVPARSIALGPKGFEPSVCMDQRRRNGRDMRIGWAGNADAADKHVEVLRAAAPGMLVADRCLTQGEMGDFYNDLDVFVIASRAEGDPRTLIESMASGCFPVTTDVGIVPELVRDGIDGLVVERTPEAFTLALDWCRGHLDFVRTAGRANAERMLEQRTWSQVAPCWSMAFDAAIATASEGDRSTPSRTSTAPSP